MCYENRNLNKVLVCTVGDLYAGRQYRTPDGQTMLVTDAGNADSPGLEAICESLGEGQTLVINLRTGEFDKVSNSVKLGKDREGRLYASRFLNGDPNQTDALDGSAGTLPDAPVDPPDVVAADGEVGPFDN